MKLPGLIFVMLLNFSAFADEAEVENKCRVIKSWFEHPQHYDVDFVVSYGGGGKFLECKITARGGIDIRLRETQLSPFRRACERHAGASPFIDITKRQPKPYQREDMIIRMTCPIR